MNGTIREVCRNGLIAVTLLGMVFCTGCISVKPIHFEDDKRAAIALIDRFHSLLNAQKYEELFSLLSENARGSATRKQVAEQLRGFQQEVGLFLRTDQIRSEVKVVGNVRAVHVFVQSRYEKKSVLEEFDCVIGGQSDYIDFYGYPESIPPPPPAK